MSIISNHYDVYDRSVLLMKDVVINRNVWVGAGAIILPKITMGENAIVDAGSVVTQGVEANTIVAGNPARLIKKLDANNLKKTDTK